VDRCDECGFAYFSFARSEVGDRLLALAAEHADRLRHATVDELRAHPVEGWSALQYGCHVRDVLTNQRARIALAQVEDEPEFVPMGRDQLAVDQRYDEQDPATVAGELVAATEALVELLASLDEAGWARGGLYSYPARAVRDVDWIGRHTVHELGHHLGDVDRVLTATGRPPNRGI
jgi:hypothetical protein